jgi:hypothetical protein
MLPADSLQLLLTQRALRPSAVRFRSLLPLWGRKYVQMPSPRVVSACFQSSSPSSLSPCQMQLML